MLTRLTYFAIAFLALLIGFATEIWGPDSDLPVYLYLAIIVLFAGLTLASVVGMTAPVMEVHEISGVVSDVAVDGATESFVIPGHPKSGRTRGVTSCRIGSQRACIRTVANLQTGSVVTAAGIPGPNFEMLAVRDRDGIRVLPDPAIPYDRPDREILLAIASLLVVIGFLICFRVKRNYDLTMSWRDAVRRATEIAQRSPSLDPIVRF